MVFFLVFTVIPNVINMVIGFACIILFFSLTFNWIWKPKVKAFFKEYLINPITGVFNKMKISDERLKENIIFLINRKGNTLVSLHKNCLIQSIVTVLFWMMKVVCISSTMKNLICFMRNRNYPIV